MLPTNPDAILFTESFLGIGLLCIGLGVWLRQRELAPRHWIQTNGTILESRIEKQYAGHGGYQFIPIIEYEYSYNERTYKSSRRRSGNYSSGKNKYADALTARYP